MEKKAAILFDNQLQDRSFVFTTQSTASTLAADLFNFVATDEPVLPNVKGGEGIVHPETKKKDQVAYFNTWNRKKINIRE